MLSLAPLDGLPAPRWCARGRLVAADRGVRSLREWACRAAGWQLLSRFWSPSAPRPPPNRADPIWLTVTARRGSVRVAVAVPSSGGALVILPSWTWRPLRGSGCVGRRRAHRMTSRAHIAVAARRREVCHPLPPPWTRGCERPHVSAGWRRGGRGGSGEIQRADGRWSSWSGRCACLPHAVRHVWRPPLVAAVASLAVRGLGRSSAVRRACAASYKADSGGGVISI